ncbi:hypothetical protein FH972_027013 [Carpinus fangiana]|uniref:Disease resistance protein At4g27190-like leucine-rich repeats domain-containing protein n=1 Tax=Carpinus fangiana TaxID=176857 RepID=A0A5N6L5Y6_9ROSI|nr:hypothetical protein FH972_027013 [Carpinus fangiana]
MHTIVCASFKLLKDKLSLQVVFPILERLQLSSVNLVETEQNQHPVRFSCILRNSQAMSRFENLSHLEVRGIGNIKYILPFSIARFMVQLKHLHVIKCEVMEEILVVDEFGVKDEITLEVLFPLLECLYLEDLPILKRFCFGSNIEFSSLKTLKIKNCPKVETFVSKPLSSDKTINKELRGMSAEETPLSVKQPFFNEEARFPKLVYMLLRSCDNIWRGQFLEECFCKLKSLYLISNHNEADVSLPNFVKRLHNLNELHVSHTFLEEIFPYEELLDQENYVGMLAQLRVLKLRVHPKLTHLWNEDTQPCPIFHNLDVLEVSYCGILKMLVPSSVSFQNLSRLEILKCHGLINLVASSTAKSLVQLKKLSVSECKTIKEIVSGDRGEGNDQVITFSKLTSLKLDCLPQLSNFCSGGYSLEFPSLEEVIVSKCQEMKIFSNGVLSTPKLKRVQATKEDEGYWKDDLNTTIHWLWESERYIPQWLF